MRSLLSFAVLFGLAGIASADDAKKPDDEKKPSLKVGDMPPALQATKWLQGKPVEQFEKDKIYVVEFWATWCGPCIAVMPHVAQLQKEFRDAGVTVVGFTAKDPNNTAEKVAEFVSKRGKKLGYTFAFADNRDTYEAYMKAAGQGGIPCSFVVGKDGKIAFIGHPALLDEVLPKLTAGTWDSVEGAKEVAKADAEFDKVFAAVAGDDIEGGLKAFAEFETNRPRMARSAYLVAPRLSLLIRAKKFEDARVLAERVIAEAADQEDPYLLKQVSAALRTPAARAEKSLAVQAVAAAEAMLKLAGDKDVDALLAVADSQGAAGNSAKSQEFGRKAVGAAEAAVAAEGDKKTPRALVRLAEAHFAAGDAAKAREVARQAVDAAPNEGMKKALQKMAEKFGPAEKKDSEK